MDLQTRAGPVRADTADDKAMTVEACIATERAVEVMDYDRWEPIDETLVSRGCEHPERVPLLNAHQRYDFECVLGSGRDIRIGADVTARLHFDGGDEKGRDAYRKAKDGHLTDVSVGYRVLESTTIERGQSGLVAGRTYTAAKDKRLRVVTRWKLREVSLVPIGADEMAKIRAAYEAGRGRERAMLPTDGTPDQAAAPAAPAPLDLRQEREKAAADALRAERERVKSIRDIAEGVPSEVVQKAIDEGWDKARTATEFLAAFRAKTSAPISAGEAPYGFGKSGPDSEPKNRLRALGFGLRHQIGAPVKPIAEVVRDYANEYRSNSDHAVRAGSGPLPPRKFGVSDAARGIAGADLPSKTYERAAEEGYAFRNLSLLDYLSEVVEIATGSRAPRGSQSIIDAYRTVCRGEGLRAGSSVTTADLANVFTDSVTAQLIASYELAGDTTIFVRETDIADFRSQERPRGTAVNPMQLMPDSGAMPAGLNSLGDTVETYKAARFADRFAFDERDFINDRLDLFRSIPMLMGRNAGQVRPDAVYFIILNGATAGLAAGAIFSSGNGNYVSSSGTLGEANLKTGIKSMRIQTEASPNGTSRILNIEPRFLLTPQATRWTGLELMNSTLIVVSGGTTQGVRGSANTLQGALTVVSDARWDNGVKNPFSKTGASASADADGWALVAGQEHPTIEVGYVRATGRAPVVRSYELREGQWGMGWDVKLDLGVKALDYRGLYRSAGA